MPKALNGVSGEAANQLVWALSEGGHMVDLPGGISVQRPGVRIDSDYVVRGDGPRLGHLARMIDEGHLRVELQDVFELERAPEALEVVLARHVRGKVALKIA